MAAMASKFNFECVIQYYTDQWCVRSLWRSEKIAYFCYQNLRLD